MSPSDLISIVILCALIAPAFILLGLGLRYLFYSVDAWNLDKFYEKFFEGRRKRKHRQFTQRIGLVLVIIGLIYTWLVVWPIFSEVLWPS